MPYTEEEVAAFLQAVGNGELDVVKGGLAEHPELVNAIGPHPFWGGRPQALHVAIETNRGKMIKTLLKAGADVNGKNDSYAGWSPLMLASHDKRKKWQRVLREHGAKIGFGEALLLGDDERLKKLLKKQLPTSPEGSWLALARTPKAIDWLVARGASTELKDRWGATPMEAISRSGKRAKKLLRHLAERGIAVDAEAYARTGDKQQLKAQPPEARARPTVVKGAVDFRHHELVAWLLAHGADPNARSTHAATHDTCLHSAVWNGDVEMVELLLAHGADPTLRDDEHHGTPLDWAEVAARVTNNEACVEAGKAIVAYTTRQASPKVKRGSRGKSADGSP